MPVTGTPGFSESMYVIGSAYNNSGQYVSATTSACRATFIIRVTRSLSSF